MTDLGKLDDEDYPAFTTGQAAELLGVQQAFLRSLDAAGVVSPRRSSGGHRRYSRRQLAIALRLRRLFDDGHPLVSADQIVGLQDELEAARAEITVLRLRLDDADGRLDGDTRDDDNADDTGDDTGDGDTASSESAEPTAAPPRGVSPFRS